MNFPKLLKLPRMGCKANWDRLVLVSSLSAVGIITPLSTLAQTVEQANFTFSQTQAETTTPSASHSAPTLATSEINLETSLELSLENQLLTQVPRIDQTDIPRTNPPEPQPPQVPQEPPPPPSTLR